MTPLPGEHYLLPTSTPRCVCIAGTYVGVSPLCVYGHGVVVRHAVRVDSAAFVAAGVLPAGLDCVAYKCVKQIREHIRSC